MRSAASALARAGLIAWWASLWLAGLIAAPVLAHDISVVGLFENRALLKIDGQQRWLKAGERSPEGILLVSATPKSAVVEIDGKRETLNLRSDIHTRLEAPVRPSVQIARDVNGMYLTAGSINGQPVRFMIDTGASDVAISQRAAERLGIDYRRGERGRVRTAQGVAHVWFVKLRSVKLGAITRVDVDAAVVEGSAPEPALLGMSFLSTVSMREAQNVLHLEARY